MSQAGGKILAEQPHPDDADVNAEDLIVLRTAINGFLASSYGVPYNVAHGGVNMVVPDRTIRACTPPAYIPYSYECIPPEDQQALDRLLASDHGPYAARVFRDRNARSSVIRGQIDPLFRLVPAAELLELLEAPWSEPFARRYAGMQGTVIVSAPVYPAARRAAVYVLHVTHSAGYMDLFRHDGAWKVRAVHGLWIS